MANEAVLIFETELPIPFTVADGSGIERGTILKLSDPMTAAASTAANDFVAGIAAGEKIASDGRTKLEVYRRGIFKVFASGAIVCGSPVAVADAFNMVASRADTVLTGAKIVGIALETAATGESFLMELAIQDHL